MNTARTDLTPLAVLAQLLDRLDTAPQGTDAQQYRLVAQRVSALLSELAHNASAQEPLQALLRKSPALSLLYENLHYGEAGLCRAPLTQAVRAEVSTRELLARLSRPHKPSGTALEAPEPDAGAQA